MWLQFPLRGSDSLLLGVVYRNPSSPPEDDHFLIRTLGQLSSSYHFTHLLLLGDFNAPKAPWTELQCVGSSGPFTAALTEVVQQSAWTQHVVAPTRYRAGQQPSLLDLVITNERHFVDQRSQIFFKKLTTGDTEDELAFRKMRNRCKSEIRQWNIRKQATIMDLACKNRNVLFKYMRHLRRNKPSAFSLRDRNGEPTSDPTVVAEFYRDHYAEDITRIGAKKDLGIWLSPNLSFSLHLEKSAQKALAVLRMIWRTFPRITRTDFQIPYRAYVRPLLEYANPVVYSGRTKDVILIERVRRAATKMVAGLKSMDYERRLAVLDLFPLEYRRLRGNLIFTYALFEQGLANRFFTVDPANTRRGHGKKIFKLSAHTFIRQTFFSFRVVAAWNNLPEMVVHAPSRTQFKTLLDTYLRVLALENILPRAENLKSNATPFFHLCLSGERQLLNDKNKTDPGNFGESLDPVYQSVNP
ncbi:hypothetical protein CLF_105603 [Clonorchis sinensis]|uniref:Endonuclease/exonuclease/phosphatase domain-containing protein n=1 Tax=Clonorchis sinensis TaxID=79923 RepID=G7YDT0_CLOSI|nr:hypothetical protein CLF_105603 [Clonorchis sinensis]